MKNYNILMRDTNGDECWTQCEGASEVDARITAKQRWGKGWRAVEAKEAWPFYQVLVTNSEEQEQQKLINKQANIEKLANLNKRIVITPDGEFESASAAAKFYNINASGLRQRIKRQPTEYYYKGVDKAK